MYLASVHASSLACSREVRDIFVSSCEADLKAIRLTQRKQDKDNLLRRLHALKGALIVFGENGAASLCERAEEDLHCHSVLACEAVLRRLQDAVRLLIASYKESYSWVQ